MFIQKWKRLFCVVQQVPDQILDMPVLPLTSGFASYLQKDFKYLVGKW